MKRYIKYFRYVLLHKWYVFLASNILGASLWRAIMHDNSKLLPSEFIPYARTFYNADGTSKNYIKDSPEMSMAWLKHQRRNDHHWQAWVLRGDDGSTGPLMMPDQAVLEMVADWMAANMVVEGDWDMRAWYHKSRYRMQMHPHTREAVENLLQIIGDATYGRQ